MRILLLAPRPHLKGPLPKHTPRLVASLEALGCEVVVKHWGRHQDVETVRQKILGRVQDIRRVWRALIDVRPDLLVVKTSHDWNTLIRDVLLLLATRSRRPLTVLQMHGSQPETLLAPGNVLFTRMSRWLLQLSDGVLVLSSDEQVQWQRFYPAGNFYRVSNPFAHHGEPPGFPRAVLSRVLGALDPEVPLLLFVGRLMREKGILDLLHAMSMIRDATPARLLVLGDGGQAAQVATQVRDLGLDQRVILPGYLEGVELEAAYAAASVFVLPTWWIEGFPTVIAEAMHAGLPIVTTRMRGMSDHLELETNALFVPPREPAALADALLRLLADPTLRSRMGAANRDAVLKFSPEAVGREYLRVLQSVVAKAGATCR